MLEQEDKDIAHFGFGSSFGGGSMLISQRDMNAVKQSWVRPLAASNLTLSGYLVMIWCIGSFMFSCVIENVNIWTAGTQSQTHLAHILEKLFASRAQKIVSARLADSQVENRFVNIAFDEVVEKATVVEPEDNAEYAECGETKMLVPGIEQSRHIGSNRGTDEEEKRDGKKSKERKSKEVDGEEEEWGKGDEMRWGGRNYE